MSEETGKKNTIEKSCHIKYCPGIIILILQWLIRFILPIIEPDAMPVAVFGGVLGGLGIIIWWTFFSRAPKIDRWGGLLLVLISMFLTVPLLDISIATTMMGMMYVIFSIPFISLALVLSSLFMRNLSNGKRRIFMTLIILFAASFWVFLRSDGMDGNGRVSLNWRWAETNEERLLMLENEAVKKTAEFYLKNKNILWSGFRGKNRDSVIYGLRIKTNWQTDPPLQIWHKKIGPGCSSFAVLGGLFYTQEQRGEYESVSCYELNNGKPVWRHRDKVRFYDSHAGAGPRSTPTISAGKIYTLGATGILNVLDAYNGSLLWSRDTAADTGVEILTWGITSSPLIIENIVIIAVSGKMAAYNISDGEPVWFGDDGGNSYSSPHLLTIDGQKQVLLMSKTGAVSVDPFTGKELWKYNWKINDRILQPAIISEGDLIIDGPLKALKRIKIYQKSGEWKINELWTSPEMKFNFNDFVVYQGHTYGFDGPNLACMNIETGKEIWKGSRCRGWILLLADQGLMIVLTEKGEIKLIPADHKNFSEIASFQAIEGKTWNHPAIADNILLVRNSSEMAAYKLNRIE